MYKKTRLDNGVRVVTAEMHDVGSLAAGIWIKTGSRHEGQGLSGISHYLEHLVFKGTKHYSCQKIKESIEGVGGSFNGFTSEETTCYLVKMPAKYLDRGLAILSEMVLMPSLPEEEVEKERTVILEEIKMYKDLPQSYVHELIDELLWPDQPLGRSILGTAATVTAITREDLAAYRRSHYTGSNIVVSAAGNLTHAKVCARVEKAFSRLARERENGFAAVQVAQDTPRACIVHKDTEQTHLIVGFRGLERDHQLKYALGVLNVILGGNSSSRLFNEIREKRGLAYEIGTLAKRLHDTGSFLVHAGVDNAKVLEALQLILSQISDIRTAAVSSGELKRAKEFLLGQLTLALEDSMDQMLWIGDSTVTLDRDYTLRQVIRDVNLVRAADVRAAAQLIFKDNALNFALIGPQKEREPEILAKLTLEA